MNCLECAICVHACLKHLCETKPLSLWGVTAGEDLIRHFKNSSHWSLTENETDQTSLSRNESERESMAEYFCMCIFPEISCPVVDYLQRANTVYVCAMFMCCEYQRGHVATSTLALHIC